MSDNNIANGTDGEPCITEDEKSRLDKHLEKVAKKFHFKNPKFRFEKGSKQGDNYVGVIYRVVIEGQAEDGDKTQEMPVIVKCAPTDALRREFLRISNIFLREIVFYEQALPAFEKLLKEYDLQLQHYPKVYGATKESEAEILILEDLRRSDFRMISTGRKTLDYEHASLAIRTIGELHAYSFAMRVKRPEELKRLRDLLPELVFVKKTDDKMPMNHAAGLAGIVRTVLDEEGGHYRARFDSFVENFSNNMVQATDGDAAEPHAVVTHGDAWTNNMLFKYAEDAEGKLVLQDIRLLDFQLSRFASPVLDLVYLLFCCCPRQLRADYFDKLLHEYHDSLSDYLRRLDCDPVALFPFEVLLQHLERFGKFAAGMAMYTLQIFTDEDNNYTELRRDFQVEDLKKRLETDSYYKNTIRDTFKELIDRNYI